MRKWLASTVEDRSPARAAACFDPGASAAIKPVRPVRKSGSTTPAEIGGCRERPPAGHAGLLRELATARPGITPEIGEAPVAGGIERGCLSTIWSTLGRLSLSPKMQA